MKKPERDPGRGQLHRRSARTWRDEENPTGPGQTIEPSADSDDADDVHAGHDEAEDAETPSAEHLTNAGPGAGGATESSGRAKHQEGLHGGPSRKP